MSETPGQVVEKAIREGQFAEPATATIPEGWFTIGYENGRDDEKPAHRVWIDRLALGIYQVTRAEYAYFLRETSQAAPPFWDDPNFLEPQQPVVGPSWFDAVAFCEWLSGITGRSYRLPTEAEWERAACGGIEGRLYSWGDSAHEKLPGSSSSWSNGLARGGRGPP